MIKELLNGSFQDNKTKLGNDALTLVVEVAKCLVTETCLRASNEALRENCDKVDFEHVEKSLPQLVSIKRNINILCITYSNIYLSFSFTDDGLPIILKVYLIYYIKLYI